MKIYLILSFLCLWLLSNSQNWLWAHQIGTTTSNDGGKALATDVSGNIYLAARNGYTIGGVLSKHNSVGIVNWVRNCAANLTSLTVDKNGNVYACGNFWGNATFEGGSNPNLTAASNGQSYDGFVVKYDSSGNIQWLQIIHSPNNFKDEVVSIKVDAFSNVYVTGYSHKLINNIYKKNFFLKKYDAQGNIIWTQDSNWRGNANSTSLALDEMNNCYVTGGFSDSAFFGNTTLISHPGSMFLAKYSSSGSFLWAKKDGRRAGAASIHYFQGKLTLTGGVTDSTIIGMQQFTVLPYSFFIAQCDTGGQFLWANVGLNAMAESITGDRNGSTFVTGSFRSVGATFGSTLITSPKQNDDVFVLKCDSMGNFVWVVAPTGSSKGGNSGTSIAMSYNNIFLTGSFNDQTNFGIHTLYAPCPSAGTNDEMFLAAIEDNGLGVPTELVIHQTKEISGWPNPTNDYYFINLKELPTELVHFEIVNALGQTLQCSVEKKDNTTYKIELIGLTKGIYHLRCITRTNTHLRKIIKR